MAEPKSFVRVDDYGAMRIGDTKVSLDSVVYAFLQGDSADAIHRQYPALSLEQVYGAIAYYLGHRDEVNEYLKRQEKVWEEFRARCDASTPPVVERLRALRRTQAGQPS